MEHEAEDQSVLKSIRQLAEEEHRLYSHEALFGSPAGKSGLRLVKRYPLIDYDRLFRFLFQYNVKTL